MPVKLNKQTEEKSIYSPIVYDEIKEMVDAYRKDLLPGEATSAWVSWQELQDLIKANPGANGIRIYYGRHVKSTQSALGVEYQGKHNVILVSTEDKVNPAKPTSKNSNDLLNKNDVDTNLVSYSGGGVDMVPLCPPTCPNSGGL